MINTRKDNVFSCKSKRFVVSFLIVVMMLPFCGVGATNKVFKAKLLGGYVLPVGNYGKIDRSAAYGVELNLEFLSLGEQNWAHHWGFPTLGLSLAGVNLGNNDLLGKMVSVYPYLHWNVVNTEHFIFGLRAGVGLAFFTEISPLNGAYVSGIVATGIKFEFPFKDRHAILLDFGTNHLNNGNIKSPNSTMNMVFASVGYKKRFGEHYRNQSMYYRKNLPYDVMFNVSVSGGARHYNFKEKDLAACATIHADAVWKMTNCYALGVGVDAFYDGVFVKQGSNEGVIYDMHTNNRRYFIENENFANKLKVGVVMANAFTIGRVTLLLDWGIYLIDPIKNMYSSSVIDRTKERTLPIYKYDPTKEDGWNYFRAGLRCRLFDNVFAKISVKTHLYNIEFVEWGVGYTIPLAKSDHHRNKETGVFRKYKVLHPKDYGGKY